jgi:hypothetical protein
MRSKTSYTRDQQAKRRRRAFYANSRHIAEGLLNKNFCSAIVPDQWLLRYQKGRFFLLVPEPISRVSLRRFVAEHIKTLNRHPCVQADAEQVIPCTRRKIDAVLLALQELAER